MSQFQNEQPPIDPEDQAQPGLGEEEAPWQLSREDWEQTQSALGMVAQFMQQQQAQQNGDVEIPDPYADPQAFQQWIRSQAEEVVQPMQEFRQQQELSEGEERAMDIITDLQAAEGEFMLQPSRENPVGSPQLARMLADEYLEAQEARYGQGPKAAEAALTQAYKTVRDMEEQIGKAYYERQNNQMRTRLSAPQQPPAGPQEAAQVAGVYGNELDVVRAHTGGFGTGR